MNILYITSEAAPFCKTGGLADVLGSLPPAVAAEGDRVFVLLPLYGPDRPALAGEDELPLLHLCGPGLAA